MFLIAISKRRVGAKEVHERDEPHRGSAFDSPGVASIASYPGLIRSVGGQRHRCCAFLISSFPKGEGNAGRAFLQDFGMHWPTHPSSYKRESAHRCGMIHINKNGIWQNRQMPFFFLFSSYPVD